MSGKQRRKDMRSVVIQLTENGSELIEKIDEYDYRKIMEHITEFSVREIKGMMRAAEKLDLLLGSGGKSKKLSKLENAESL